MTISRPHFLGILADLFTAVSFCFAALVVVGDQIRTSESQVIKVTGSARKYPRHQAE